MNPESLQVKVKCSICGDAIIESEIVTVNYTNGNESGRAWLCPSCHDGLTLFDFNPYLLMSALRHMFKTDTAEYNTKTHPTEVKKPKQTSAFIKIMTKMYSVHLDKNQDYSSANILGTGETGLATRIWDKVARLMNLVGYRIEIESSSFETPVEPKNESRDDNILDAAVYCIIWMILRIGAWGK
jgi:hypothetical protein